MLLDLQGDMNVIKKTMNELKKLSDEEKAENYIKENYAVYDLNAESLELAIQLYLDGMEKGRKDRNCVNCSNHGKQFEVMKMKAQITELEKRINTLKIKNASLQKKNEQQAKQIEKMKCCEVCSHKKGWKGEMPCLVCKFNPFGEGTEDKWELAEKEL